jgi:carbonic anhydrase
MSLEKIATRTLGSLILMQTIFIYTVSPMMEWNSLLKSNKKFVKSHAFVKQRAPLKNKQNPPVIVLSCADSRVTPELIFNQKLGSLFVVRVAGQVVDDVVIDSIEYAVGTFDSHVLVVLGHSNCGAVAGALEHLQKNAGALDKPRGHLNAVLIPIEKAITEAGINIHGADALEKSIHANVKYMTHQLVQRSKPIAKAVKDGDLIIVGAEYSLSTGRVKQLFNY